MNRLVNVSIAVVVVALGGAAFLLGGARGAVDWRRLRAVAIESDDWGLAGFVPDAGAWRGLDREALDPGRFPPVYWGSTLEDSSAVADLAAVLASVRGRDDLPAVFQANYVLASLDWQDERWQRYAWPEVPPAYRRPGLWSAVTAARARGVWRAEFHATWHYDPQRRQEAGLTPGVARAATLRGITLFPGSERARELGPWRDPAVLAAELDTSLARFAEVFGRPAVSVVAPDYAWNGGIEDLWETRGLTVVQGKREQRNPDLPRGTLGRVRKLLERRRDVLLRPGRTYLERNCRFEPVQEADPAHTRVRCAREVAAAWHRGEPAIIESHRVNFAHTDPAVAATGRRYLTELLTGIAAADPVFLTDDEVAQLARGGVSRVLRGGTIVLRNPSGSRRMVTVPVPLLAAAGGAGVGTPLVVAVPARTSGQLAWTGAGWRIDARALPMRARDASF